MWVIHCEPHVSMRFKRVFAGLGKHRVGTHRISDTTDNARDLEWFMERYPLVVDESARPHLCRRAELHRERQSIVDSLLANVAPPPPFNLAIPPREYQRLAAAMALAGRGLLLADDVGIGKTCSAICTFADPRTLPALVVTLTHLPRQWAAEIEKFAPNLAVHIVKQGRPYEITARRGKRNGQLTFDDRFPDVVIINYHKLVGWAETLAKVVRSVVFDECQELRRGGDSNKYGAARLIAGAAEFRMGLSATPIYNYGGEMFHVMDCIAPGALGTADEFHTEWCDFGYADKARIKSPKAFGAYMRDAGLMLRRTRADVGRELPPITKIPHHIDSDPAALDRVSGSCAELAKLILAQGESRRGEKLQASEEFSNRLRQATGIAKAPYVAEFVRLLVESGEQVVLYGWHREVYSIWLDRLKDLRPALYTGSESPTQKDQAKDAFLKGESQVLVISLRAGAGLDGLQQRCRTVVFGELDWSPGVHEQCIGRVARDGQKDGVAAYFLLAEDGADPVIAQVLGLKKQQIDGIRETSDDLIEKLEVDTGRVRMLAEAYLGRRQDGAAA
jgi:SNF2 family DNA or RNA helicase